MEPIIKVEKNTFGWKVVHLKTGCTAHNCSERERNNLISHWFNHEVGHPFWCAEDRIDRGGKWIVWSE